MGRSVVPVLNRRIAPYGELNGIQARRRWSTLEALANMGLFPSSTERFVDLYHREDSSSRICANTSSA